MTCILRLLLKQEQVLKILALFYYKHLQTQFLSIDCELHGSFL